MRPRMRRKNATSIDARSFRSGKGYAPEVYTRNERRLFRWILFFARGDMTEPQKNSPRIAIERMSFDSVRVMVFMIDREKTLVLVIDK